MPSELRIGTGHRVITPELGCPMAGFAARQGVATKVHDDLYARALLFDDGVKRVALVSLDVIGVGRELADRMRAEVQRRCGIPASNVIVAATHTHCGPVTFNHFFNPGQALDEEYIARLVAGVVASLEAAIASRQPRRLRTGLVRAEGIAVNRRSTDGQPTDPLAGVLLVEELDGTPAAVAVNFACHPTVLGPDTLDITGDFPYFAGQRLRDELGVSETLFFNGAEGDVSMGHRSDQSAVGIIAPFRTFAKAEELGVRLGDAVIAGLPALRSEAGELAIESRNVALPLKSYVPRERALTDATPIQRLYGRIEDYYAQVNAAEAGPLVVELTAVRIGETALLSFPGEVFVELALEIRRRSPFAVTMFLGLANDYIGYVPTAGANAEAGYEVVAARVAPDAATILVDQSVELLCQLRNSVEG